MSGARSLEVGSRVLAAVAGDLVPLSAVVARAEREWAHGRAGRIIVTHPDDRALCMSYAVAGATRGWSADAINPDDCRQRRRSTTHRD